MSMPLYIIVIHCSQRCSSLVVFYLLYLSWACIHLCIPGTGFKVLKYCSVLQTYLFFAFALTLLIKAEKFGSHPECNRNAIVVLFRPFSALKSGRILGWVVMTCTIAIYTFISIKDATSRQIKRISEAIKAFRHKNAKANLDIEDLPAQMPSSMNNRVHIHEHSDLDRFPLSEQKVRSRTECRYDG
jgi:hypothetical protein